MPKKRKYRRAKVVVPPTPPATKVLLNVAPPMPHPHSTLNVTRAPISVGYSGKPFLVAR
jgi:hypothetical protein